jgi:hypothetical protein
MSLPLFPSLTVDLYVPPILYNQRGFGNAVSDSVMAWLDSKLQKVGPQEKVAHLSHLVASEAVVATLAFREKVSKELSVGKHQVTRGYTRD